MRELTVAAGVARALMDLAEARGACRQTLAARSQIVFADLEDADARIPFRSYVALMRAGQDLCNDPALALHFGEVAESPDGANAHTVGGAETLAEAFALGNRYARLSVDVEDDGSGARFQLRRVAGQQWMVDARRNPNEFPELTESTFARWACTTRRMMSGLQPFVELHFTHPEPDYRAEYERIFKVQVVFDSHWNAMRLDDVLLAAMRLPAASPYVTSIMRSRADELLERLDRARSTRDDVERVLMATLHAGEVKMDVVAGTLGLSRPTLFRRLRDEGATFEQVLDDLRHRLALEHLHGCGASVKQTAHLVGYSDPAAFSRAFKRWTGVSPRASVGPQRRA